MPTNINKAPVIDTEPDIAVGIMLPLDNDGGIFKLSYSTHEQAVSNLKNLLLTSQGERVMQPTFGTTIQQYLFQPVEKVQFSRIRRAVTTAIQYWLPYIIVEECEVTPYNIEGIGTGDHGVLIYLLIRPTERGANVPITLLYTPSTVTEVKRDLTGGLSTEIRPMFSDRTSNDLGPRAANFNRI